MPFRFRDVTAGRDLFYVDNAGQLGLGSLPNSGQAITVLGISVLDPSARFADGLLRPGAPAAYQGVVSVPPGGSVSVAISATQNPTVTPAGAASSITSSSVTFTKNTKYSIW